MIERYRYFADKYFYQKLQLEKIEKNLIEENVKEYSKKQKESNFPSNSRFFYLFNDFEEENLLLDDKIKEGFEGLFNFTIDEIISNPGLEAKVNQFIESTYKLLLMPYGKVEMLSYGNPHEYSASSDSIILALVYNEFDYPDDEDFDKNYERAQNAINKATNQLENEIGPKAGVKVKVFKYNELNYENYDHFMFGQSCK